MYATEPEDKGNLLRLRSRNHWLRNNFSEALNDTLLALKVLGVEVNPAPTRRQADALFELVKNEILAVGFDEILAMPRTTDKRVELAVTLLNEAGQSVILRILSILIFFLLQRYKCILVSHFFGIHGCGGIDGTPPRVFSFHLISLTSVSRLSNYHSGKTDDLDPQFLP